MTQLVFIENGRPVTDSLMVAESFGKEHRHVMRDIRELGCSEEFRESNFGQSAYTNAQGRNSPRFLMTEQGFTLLAMGYTGHAAMAFKERYIAEFERMRQQLTQTALVVVPSYAIDNPIERAERWIAEERERQALQLETQRQATMLLALEPKLSYYDAILRSEDTVTITQIAQDYGLSARSLNTILKEEGVQRKVKRQWVVRSNYLNRGLTKSQTITIRKATGGEKVVMNTEWTQAGRLLIHELLEKRGIRAHQDQYGSSQAPKAIEPFKTSSVITLTLNHTHSG